MSQRLTRKITSSSPLPGEIFRHVRPLFFNKKKKVLMPDSQGGISFLFLPTKQFGTYDYWIYACPPDTIFSSRRAVNALRATFINGTIPWGSIILLGKSIIDAGMISLIREDNELPTTISAWAFKIMIENLSAEYLYELHKKGNLEKENEHENSVWKHIRPS